jgi:hypothetical protein
MLNRVQVVILLCPLFDITPPFFVVLKEKMRSSIKALPFQIVFSHLPIRFD